LTLEGIYNIEGGDGLSLGVFSVSDGVTNDALEEDFEDTSGFFVDETGDTLDTTTTCETTNGRFRDSLWMISKGFAKECSQGNIRMLSRRILR
jgi:hypothetical protein